MLDRLRVRWRPDAYQGSGARGEYFEGWYYKIVDGDEKERMAIIPGVSLGRSSGHAFIQILDGLRSTYDYHEFKMDEFSFSTDQFKVEIGPNKFSGDRIELHLKGKDRDADGVLSLNHLHPWPVRLWSPGAMGVLSLVPGIPCYHHILSLGHCVMGKLAFGKRELDFDGGRGYAEKNWGSSFPSTWIWMQSNHFQDPDVSFMLAVARMDFHARPIQGLTCGLMQGNQLHRFCTWSGGRVARIVADDGTMTLCVENRRHRLEVEATRSDSTEMRVPHLDGMTGTVLESLSSRLRVTLSRKDGGRVLEDTGRCAGFEVGGHPGDMVMCGG